MPHITDTCTSEQCVSTSVRRLQNKRKNSSPTFDPDEWPIIDDQAYAVDEQKCKRQKLAPLSINLDDARTDDTQLDNCDSRAQAKRPAETQKPPTSTNQLQAKYDNIHTTTVQKLTTYADRLRQEIATLKTALATEQHTVRILR